MQNQITHENLEKYLMYICHRPRVFSLLDKEHLQISKNTITSNLVEKMDKGQGQSSKYQ